MPVFDVPPTEDQKNIWLADEKRWFERGSTLWHASQHLLNDWQYAPSALVIGKPADSVDAYWNSSEVGIVSEMLYAMAVECWLKGLFLMQQPRRKSRARARKIDRFVRENFEYRVDPAEYSAQLISLFETHPMPLQHRRLDADVAAENAERIAWFDKKKHPKDHLRRHDLRHLAKMAGVKIRAKADLDYLDFLEKANMLGRFPALFEADRAVPWNDIPRQSIRKDRINAAIFNRYQALQKRHTVFVVL